MDVSDKSDATNNNTFYNTDETVNQQGNVAAGDATAGGTTTVDLGASVESATNTGVIPDVESEKWKGRDKILNAFKTYGKTKDVQSDSEFKIHENIDLEDPNTVPAEILSEDKNVDELLALDQDLIDPESVLDKEVVTLGAHYPGVEPSQ